ncbi:MAG: transposase, partial [Acidobacteriia bacterium]|nr:transposase [Terriglobia bacterium]
AVGHGRGDVVELLLSAVSRHDPQSTDHRVSLAPDAAHSGQLLIIWDGLPGHHSRAVWDFVRQQRGRLWPEYLPGYAPELNPVEYLWSHWKQHELPNFCPQDFGQLSNVSPKSRGIAMSGIGRGGLWHWLGRLQTPSLASATRRRTVLRPLARLRAVGRMRVHE